MHEQNNLMLQEAIDKAAGCCALVSSFRNFKGANRSRGRKNAEASHSLGDSILEKNVKDLGEKEKMKSRIAFVLFGVVVWWFGLNLRWSGGQ